MEMVTLGKTGITVHKNGFGALPIQRISIDDAVALARRAYEAGMTFFDTARFYTDSEEKLGEAFNGMREKVCIATKTAAQNAEDFWKDLEVSLHNLRTDYIDIYQFHNPSFCPKPGDGTGLYEAMLEAKAQGKIHHIGITNHRLAVANEAIDSGLYETLQFPFCYLATEKDLELVKKCKEADMGFIAMWGSLFWAQRSPLRPYLQEKKPMQMLKIHEQITCRKKGKIRRKLPKNQNIKENTVEIAQKITLQI